MQIDQDVTFKISDSDQILFQDLKEKKTKIINVLSYTTANTKSHKVIQLPLQVRPSP